MAIEDVLYGFNPMDIVRGYEYGIEKGQNREKGEEEIKRQRLFNQITEMRDLENARLAGMQTGAKIRAFNPELEQERARLENEASASRQSRLAAEEFTLAATQPGRLQATIAEQESRYSPEAVGVRIEGDRAADQSRTAQAKASAAGFQSLEADQQAIGEAQRVLQDFEAEERRALANDPMAPRMDAWEKTDRAISRVQNPRAQQLLQQRRDNLALQGMTGAAQSGDVDTMNLYLKRYGRNFEIGQTQVVDANGRTIAAYQLFQLSPVTDADGNTTMQRTPTKQFYAVDRGNPNWIGNSIPGFLGLGPQPQQQRGATRTPTGARPVNPPRPSAATQREGQLSPEEGAGAAAGGRRAGALTDQQRRDLQEFNRRQPRTRNAPPGGAGGGGDEGAGPATPATPRVSPKVRQQGGVDLSKAYDALDAQERFEAQALSDEALRVTRQMMKPGGNTKENQALYSDLRERLDALLAGAGKKQASASAGLQL